MTWDRTTIPYCFKGLDVRAWAEDEQGAFLIEYDRTLLRPFLLYRYWNQDARGGYRIARTYRSIGAARRGAERLLARINAREVTA